MRGEPGFLGVYAKEGIGGNARLWYAWGLPDGKFMLQEMEQKGQSRQRSPLSGKTSEQNILRLEPDEFFAEYRVFSASSSKQQPEFPLAGLDHQDNPAVDEHGRRNPSERDGPGQAGYRVDLDKAPFENAASRESFPYGGASQGRAPENSPEVVSLWQKDPSKKVHGSRSYSEPAQPAPNYETRKRKRNSDPWAKEFSGYGNPYRSSFEDETGADYTVARGQREMDSAYQIRNQTDFTQDNKHKAEFSRAELVARVEENFRTEFSMALIRLKNKRSEALRALESLVNSNGPFSEEHKFMFTDCGLALRKRNLFALAKQFHLKARELSPHDEHILFNLARVMYESGKIDKAREYLSLSMELAPNFEEAKDFLAFIEDMGIS
jgi:tetratricopeptide (TPR) repeat protein